MALLVVLTTICVLIGALILYRRNNARSRLPLPPGPKKLPLVGNLFDIPPTFQWKTYMEWSKTYDSDILHLDIAGASTIVLSSSEVVTDLLEKRSALYSDRASVPTMSRMTGSDFLVGFMRYGEYWRSHRRLFHRELHATAAQAFQPRERAATHGVLRKLLDTPDDFMDHLRQMAGEIIMSVAYGIKVLPSNDPYAALAEKAMHELAIISVPGKYLVDSIPILKYVPEWFPGAGFKREVKVCRELCQALVEKPFAQAKRSIAAGIAVPSFVSESLRSLDEYEPEMKAYHEKIVKETAGTMYIAGADTTVSVFATFILGMLANPEAQKAAQREIDALIGDTRLPNFQDEPALPYLSAIVKEALRWENVTPIAIPHFLPIEDEYRGYRLPAGSVVIPNVWALLHNETTYPDPYAFKPDRFLLNGKLNPAVKSPEAAFGFGRRVCPGRHLASSSLFITIASILATFNITKSIAEDGKEIEPSYDYAPGLVCQPLPFRCSIKPRSRRSVELIQATFEE
ncbi:cytochrome P450 [Mycena galericulata]|nr:cytochrome P450 [Mycena galericulata]